MICAHCTASIPDSEVCQECGREPILHERYRLEEIVGTGAFGTTYRATQLDTAKVVAIKELLVRKVDSLKAIELFEREAGVLAQLNHPGIPNFIEEFNEEAGRSVSLYLVQEFIDGTTLAAELEEHRFGEPEVLEVLLELLDILNYLHELHPPVIHRDIKPRNIMRRLSGELVLIDFGSVRESVDTKEGGSTVAGTFGYMAPEQFMGRALPATDIFGLGRTAIHLMTRQDPAEVTVIQGASEGMLLLLQDMTANDLGQRPKNAKTLGGRVRSLLTGGVQLPPRQPNAPQSALASAMIPAPPRPLPANFNARRFDTARFQLIFGAVFGGVGTVAGLAPLTLALLTGEVIPLILGIVFLVVFGGLGGSSLALGVRKMRLVRDLYQNGVVTMGIVHKQGWSNYRINRQHARVHFYRFNANGRVQNGKVSTFEDYPLLEGEEVPVIYDPRNPRRNAIYPIWD